ncbi:GspH/FimT family pseudopilin [Arsukibacterium sp. UBA3155]|uniref:GspH/FimT family pseudopilin n=1 Tax=Arsukibacterium sp. UBA3155 TaxID=1946058 RepID=UPI0025BE9318|nr:GspH/FimT family pseudopilin [Arsukibacterium sp. UBA3155]|tara:strand:- start:74182 stop:74691 length:510 start_codon:yes stop_codon:yes gene_type:complete
MTHFSKHAGLTLLELVLGLAIMAILLQVALPAMAELINKQRAGSYMAQFSRHLGFARIQAANSQQPVRVCPLSGSECQSNWHNYPLIMSLINPHTDTEFMLRQIPPVFSQHQLKYNRSQIQFRRDGSLNALENGTFYYCPQPTFRWHYTLVLNQAGRNRLTFHHSPCPD